MCSLHIFKIHYADHEIGGPSSATEINVMEDQFERESMLKKYDEVLERNMDLYNNFDLNEQISEEP